MRMKKILLICVPFVILAVAASLYFFNKDQNKQTSAVTDDEKYNDEQEDVTGPGTDTVSYGLYEEDGQILDSLDIGKKNGKRYKKVLSISHYFNDKRKYGLVILSDFKTIPFKADNGGYKKSYTFKMDKDSVKKIKLEFEPPSNFSELSFIIIPEPDYKQESTDLDIASGLQENFTLRYIRKSRDEKEDLKPQKITDELTGEQVFLTSNKTGNKILFKSKSNQKAYLQIFNSHDTNLDYALVALSGTEQRSVNGKPVSFTSVKENATNIYEIDMPKVEDKENYQIVLFPTPYKTSTMYEGLNNTSDSTFRTVITP
ncbi:hypothetical protein AVM03_07150 [Bacillus amyloliquefaciens]|nr:hypothetical protein AVM03_07150 [Bacillus amyloliquefaciens]